MSNAIPKDPKVLHDSSWTQPTDEKDKEEALAAKELAGQKSNLPTMEVKVESPFTNYFNGTAISISAVNATGPFDILPQHHNFISLLASGTLVIRAISGEEQKINIAGGLMHVKADRVIVFLDV